MYEVSAFLLEIFVFFNIVFCVFLLFIEYDLWELSSSFVLVDESSPCSTAKKRFSLKYGT